MDDKTLLGEYLKNFEKLLESDDNNYDVKIIIKHEEKHVEFHAHSVILCAQSPFFKNALLKTNRDDDDHYVINKSNISEIVFKAILKFIYTFKIELRYYTGAGMLNLLIAADEFGLESLIDYTIEYFIENHKKYINDNAVKVLQSIYSNEGKFNKLKDICLEKICADGGGLFKLNEFIPLEELILLEILKRNDFCVDEIDVWEGILKWGLAKHPEISNKINVENWTKKNITNLEKTLKDLILLIRFKDISNRDFRYKVMPYWKLFPKALWKNLLDYYVFPDDQSTALYLPQPPRIPNIDSNIINQKLMLLFASWIDKKDTPYTSFNDLKYKFKLLYRSSRDGLYAASVFHQKCDNINKTLVVAKMQNSEQIIGGYNPLNWNGDEYKYTTESFIFNTNNKGDAQFSRVINNDYSHAIGCFPTYFPVFGDGYDVYFNNMTGRIISYPNTYNDINLLYNNNFDELEVFQIICKK